MLILAKLAKSANLWLNLKYDSLLSFMEFFQLNDILIPPRVRQILKLDTEASGMSSNNTLGSIAINEFLANSPQISIDILH